MPGDVTQAEFDKYINAANNALSAFDLEIRSTFHQVSRLRVYSLINSTSDAVSQLATSHSPDEISYLKRLLDAMFETNNTPRQEVMAITSMQAVRLSKAPGEVSETQNGTATQGSGGQGLTMVQAEKMLVKLVDERWFEKSRTGYYSLTPRALMELRQWLLETYNDNGEDDDDDDDGPGAMKIKLCVACREIITVVSGSCSLDSAILKPRQGQRCPKRNCPCRLHDICAQGFWRTQPSRQCPICKTEWTGNNFVGEKAVVSSERNTQVKRKSGGPNGRKSAQAPEVEEELEGNEEGD